MQICSNYMRLICQEMVEKVEYISVLLHDILAFVKLIVYCDSSLYARLRWHPRGVALDAVPESMVEYIRAILFLGQSGQK